MFFYTYLLFEIIALLSTIVRYKAISNSIFKYFTPYLLFVVFYEIGSARFWFNINNSNLWISNLTMFFSFIFYVVIIHSLFKKPSFKKGIKVAAIITTGISLANALFFQGFWKLDTISILLQYAVLTGFVCLYFYELMNSFDFRQSILKLPGFWLNTGLLFFCLAQFLFFSSFAYMAYKNDYNYYLLFSVVSNIANVILYSCLTISILCFRKMNR